MPNAARARARLKRLAQYEIQEAPLTLTGQRDRCRNIKGNAKYLEASLAQGHSNFSSGCGFMVGLGKPKMCTKFEVASFSHGVNIGGEPQILGASLAQGHARPFFCV